jgi:hypothetical protein
MADLCELPGVKMIRALLSFTVVFSLFLSGCGGDEVIVDDGPDTAEEEMSEEEIATEEELAIDDGGDGEGDL